MRFLKHSNCCSRCGQPASRKNGLRSSCQASGKVVRILYCLPCQQAITIGHTAKAVDARRQLWPEGKAA